MYIITSDKSTSVAFTGHRRMNQDTVLLKEALTTTLNGQYTKGYRTFFVGVAQGFDLLAAEAILELQQRYSDIQLFCVVPYAGHHSGFDEEDKQRFTDIADRATVNITLSDKYYDGCFLRRNDYMINNSSLLIAYHDGGHRSGTAYTVRRAEKQSIPVINLYHIK